MMKKLAILLACFSINAFATPVNVNTADAKTIADSLNGIGLKKAEAIVKYREEKGPFKTTDDLANVNGIGKKTIEKNKTDILLGDSTATTPATPATPDSAPTVPATKTDKKNK